MNTISTYAMIRCCFDQIIICKHKIVGMVGKKGHIDIENKKAAKTNIDSGNSARLLGR